MKYRNPLLTGVLTLFSLGFYGTYWLSSCKQYVEEKGLSVPVLWPFGVLVLLLPVDFISSLYLQTKYVERAAYFGRLTLWAGTGVFGLCCVLYMHWAYTFNKRLEQASSGTVASIMSILPFGLGFIGIAVLQSQINKSINPHQASVAPYSPEHNTASTSQSQAPVNTPLTGSDWQEGITTLQPTVVSAQTAPAANGPTQTLNPPQAPSQALAVQNVGAPSQPAAGGIVVSPDSAVSPTAQAQIHAQMIQAQTSQPAQQVQPPAATPPAQPVT